MNTARQNGMQTAIIRLSNVFGSLTDHADRVVPAFAKAAVLGQALRVDGAEHTFDFTHIDDVSRGIVALAQLLQKGESRIPPIHFVTGKPTTLSGLAEMAISIASSTSNIEIAPPRNYDVDNFYGCPMRAKKILNWEASIPLRVGLSQLIEAFQKKQQKNVLSEIVR
jgi:nucleoside-diphosphate-sugar epimerase